MKTNFIKRTSAAIMAAIVASSAAVVNANLIETLPYSNDFSGASNAGIGTNIWIQQAWSTGFDASGMPIEVIEDQDDEDRGKVIKLHKNDASETLIMWTLPEVTSGKFMFEIDIKSLGSDFYLSANQGDHTVTINPVFTALNNSILAGDSNGTLIDTYNINEWNRVKVLFDIDAKQMTTFFNGKSETVSSIYDYPYAMEFTAIGSATGGVCFDNISAYIVDDTVKPSLVLESNGKTVGAYVSDEQENFTLSLNNTYFADLPEVSMTCLGDDIMSDEDDTDVSITAEYNDGKVEITLEDYLELGSKYRISIPDGTKDMFGRTIGETSVVFNCAENDGWVVLKKMEEDFDMDSINYVYGSWFGSIYQEFGLFEGSADSIKLVSDNSYSAGKAIKVDSPTRLEVAGLSFVPKKGRVRLDAKMDLGKGVEIGYYNNIYGPNRARLMYGQYIDMDGDGIEDKTINYHYTDKDTNNLYDKWVLSEGMDTISYKMNFGTKTTEITHNGETFEKPLVTNDHLTGYGFDIIDQFNRFSIIVNSEPVIIDYFNIYHEYNPAIVNTIEATKITNGKAAVNSDIAIKFSKAVDTNTLSNITVSNGTENATYTGEWNSDTNTYTLTFDENLAAETKYTVTVPATVMDTEGYAATSAYGTFTTDVEQPIAVRNLKATKTGKQVKVTADIENPKAATVYLVVASYSEKAMQEMHYQPVSVDSLTGSIEYTFDFNDMSADTVKAFALVDMQTIKPYCAAVTAE